MKNLVTAEMLLDFFTTTDHFWECFGFTNKGKTIIFDGSVDLEELAAYLNKRLEEMSASDQINPARR